MKNRLTGWRDVFAFTFRQTIKSKAYTGTLIFLVIFGLLSMPLLNLILGNSAGSSQGSITKVYILNETGLSGLTLSGLKAQEGYQALEIEQVSASDTFDSVAAQIQEEETSAVLIRLQTSADGDWIEVYRSSDGPVKQQELGQFAEKVQRCFQLEKLQLLGLTNDQIQEATTQLSLGTYRSDETGAEIILEDTSITTSEYWFMYALLFIVLMVSTLAASQIATSIVSDKSSKVVEFLLTSIRPLAIIVGKVLSMLFAVILQLLGVAAAAVVSSKLSEFWFPEAGNPLGELLSPDILSNLKPVNLLLCLVMVFLGLIFYATLAGLAGATVSRIEEVGEGQMLFTIADLIGAYVGIGAASTLMGTGVNGFVTFAFLFPLSSPYILPGAILTGRAGIALTAGAVVLELIAVILLFLFVARVYEVLILHNGERIRLKELLRIFKSAKGGSRHE